LFGQVLNAEYRIDGIPDDGVIHFFVKSDVSHHHFPGVDADADVQRDIQFFFEFGIDAGQGFLHFNSR
jgi:hypothetical protein